MQPSRVMLVLVLFQAQPLVHITADFGTNCVYASKTYTALIFIIAGTQKHAEGILEQKLIEKKHRRHLDRC